MRALLLLPWRCTVVICLVILGIAALASLVAGDTESAAYIWAVIRKTLNFILKGDAL